MMEMVAKDEEIMVKIVEEVEQAEEAEETEILREETVDKIAAEIVAEEE